MACEPAFSFSGASPRTSGAWSATTAGFSLLLRYQPVGSALSDAMIFGKVSINECLGRQPRSAVAREMSIS